MSNVYASSKYKNKIINLLYQNDNFITLMNPTPSECKDLDIIDVLNGGEWIIDGKKWTEQGYVFDYDFVDETVMEEKTFCFVETDIDTVTDNTYVDFNLYICIFTHKNLVRLTPYTSPTAKQVKEMGYFATDTYANRIDALCDCVDQILNGTDKLAGLGDVNPSERSYMSIYTPSTKYYGKCLRYYIRNYNSGDDYCGD